MANNDVDENIPANDNIGEDEGENNDLVGSGKGAIL